MEKANSGVQSPPLFCGEGFTGQVLCKANQHLSQMTKQGYPLTCGREAALCRGRRLSQQSSLSGMGLREGVHEESFSEG